MYEITFQEYGLGQIQIDDFVESFESDHSYWSPQDYETQWKEARSRVDRGLPAIFFTSISAPDTANFYRTWICYPDRDELAFHEWVMFLDQLDAPFNAQNPHVHIPEYQSHTEDGQPISEWRTSAFRV